MADIVRPGESAAGPINSDAMPDNVDIEIYEGDDLDFEMEVRDAANTLVNLTGYTAKGQVKTSYADLSPLTLVTTIPTPTNGIVKVSLANTVTAGLTAGGDYIYDIQLTNPSGKIRTYLTGDIIVLPEVTT